MLEHALAVLALTLSILILTIAIDRMLFLREIARRMAAETAEARARRAIGFQSQISPPSRRPAAPPPDSHTT